MICKISLSVILFLNEVKPIYLHTNMAIASTQLIGFNYCNLPLIILLNIDYSFADNEVVTSVAI